MSTAEPHHITRARERAECAAAQLAFAGRPIAVFGQPDAHADTARCSSLPPTPPTPHETAPDQAKQPESDQVRACGAYADHVDHIATRRDHPGSALTAAGSTRRWRRLRAYVLNRDAYRCQVLVDAAGAVVEAPRPATPPAGPDDPAWLRATCPHHNLSRGAASTDARPTANNNNRRPSAGRWDW